MACGICNSSQQSMLVIGVTTIRFGAQRFDLMTSHLKSTDFKALIRFTFEVQYQTIRSTFQRLDLQCVAIVFTIRRFDLQCVAIEITQFAIRFIIFDIYYFCPKIHSIKKMKNNFVMLKQSWNS